MGCIQQVQLPEFGGPSERPSVPTDVYNERMKNVVREMNRRGIEVLVVYGDREHFANIAYLTGFDPRFEEALFLLDKEGSRKLLVGNECLGYLPEESLRINAEVFQDFSLMGQPRETSRSLKEIFFAFGIVKGTKVGCVGWKIYSPALVNGDKSPSDLPAYILDELRQCCGDERRVCNVIDLFMDVQHGHRVFNEPEQIVEFEYAASRTSAGVRDFLKNLAPGVRENQLEACLDSHGLPLSCHRMIAFGEKVKRGLASPSDKSAEVGDPFNVAFGVTGGLTCRAGCVASGPEDIPEQTRDFHEQFLANYFDVTVAWYESVAVSVQGGEVYDAVEHVRDQALFEFAVNPGHYLHLDEWVNSPFYPGSEIVLKSGMVLQMDIIPLSNGSLCYANAEDGVLLADAELQEELRKRFPECWQRLSGRQKFVRNTLGIALHETVFPLSDTTGWFPPYALDLSYAFVNCG